MKRNKRNKNNTRTKNRSPRKKTKSNKFNVRSRDCTLMENEILYTYKDIDHNDLENFDIMDHHSYYKYPTWTNDKWKQLPLAWKQAYAYHQRNQKVFQLEDRLVSFLLPMMTTVDQIDKAKLKGLPKAFIVDVQHSTVNNFFCVEEEMFDNFLDYLIDNDVENSQQTAFFNEHYATFGINSILIYFEDETGNICDPTEFSNICFVSKILCDKNSKSLRDCPFYNKHPLGDPMRDYDIAQLRLFRGEDNFKVFEHDTEKPNNFELSTIEETLMSKIDAICKEKDIGENARNSYSNAYLRAVGELKCNGDDSTILDHLFSEKEEDRLDSIRKTLLVPLLQKSEITNSISVCRRILASNLVISFLKAYTDKQVISSSYNAIHPLHRNRKRNRGKTQTYSYITIDSDSLTTLKRERRNTVRRSERYQTQVAKTMGYRWVREGTPQGLRENEDIYDIVEDTVTGVVKYKVKRPIQGYTRNAHLPKKLESETAPKRSTTKVKSFL